MNQTASSGVRPQPSSITTVLIIDGHEGNWSAYHFVLRGAEREALSLRVKLHHY
jgi:hypothetical protein